MGREQRVSELLTNNHLTNNDLTINHLTNKSKKNWLMVNRYSDKNSFTKRSRRGYTGNLARSKASYISEKLRDAKSFRFYLKCAWNLTDQFLDQLLVVSLKKDDPAKYFTAVAKNEMDCNN